MAFQSSNSRANCLNNMPRFDEGVRHVCTFFNVPSLLQDQLKALKAFLSGRDVYFSAPTGFGKSLVFQALPLMYDVMKDNLVGSSFVLVLSPLTALIEEQVEYINTNIGLNAVYLHDGLDQAVIESIENGGTYSLIYASPGGVLTGNRWRSMLTSKRLREDCIAVAVDEAHCIVHW